MESKKSSTKTTKASKARTAEPQKSTTKEKEREPSKPSAPHPDRRQKLLLQLQVYAFLEAEDLGQLLFVSKSMKSALYTQIFKSIKALRFRDLRSLFRGNAEGAALAAAVKHCDKLIHVEAIAPRPLEEWRHHTPFPLNCDFQRWIEQIIECNRETLRVVNVGEALWGGMLTRQLSECHRLERIDLHWQYFLYRAGIRETRMSEMNTEHIAKKSLPRLRSLSLSFNTIGRSTRQRLLEEGFPLTSLYLHAKDHENLACVFAPSFAQLQTLRLELVTSMKPAKAHVDSMVSLGKAMKGMQALTDLSISFPTSYDTKISDKGLEGWEGSKHLRDWPKIKAPKVERVSLCVDGRALAHAISQLTSLPLLQEMKLDLAYSPGEASLELCDKVDAEVKAAVTRLVEALGAKSKLWSKLTSLSLPSRFALPGLVKTLIAQPRRGLQQLEFKVADVSTAELLALLRALPALKELSVFAFLKRSTENEDNEDSEGEGDEEERDPDELRSGWMSSAISSLGLTPPEKKSGKPASGSSSATTKGKQQEQKSQKSAAKPATAKSSSAPPAPTPSVFASLHKLYCEFVDDAFFRSCSFPNLAVLEIGREPTKSPKYNHLSSLQLYFNACPSLQALTIAGVNIDNWLPERPCGNLHSFTLRCLPQSLVGLFLGHDDTFLAILNLFASMSGKKVEKSKDDKKIQKLLALLPGLKELHICCNEVVSGSFVQQITQFITTSKRAELELVRFTGGQGTGERKLFRALSKLKRALHRDHQRLLEIPEDWQDSMRRYDEDTDSDKDDDEDRKRDASSRSSRAAESDDDDVEFADY